MPADSHPYSVADGSPEFANYDNIIEWITERCSDAVKICPAFKEGCPFSDVQDTDALYRKLQKVPASHAGGGLSPKSEPGEGPASLAPGSPQSDGSQAHEALQGVALLNMLQAVHQNCVTSSGTPLTLELAKRSWGKLVPDASPWATQDPRPSRGRVPSFEMPPAEAATVAEAPSLLGATGASQGADGTVAVEGLAGKLKQGTKDAHKAAETVHFVHEFIKGKVTREVYAQLVVNLYHIYAALEEALELCEEHPLVDSVHFPEELERAPSLWEDAAFFHGPDWESKTAPSEVTREYVERLRRVGREFPELLAPHAYTRYLGDLSGGQVLRRAAVRGLGLPDDGTGVKFYIFKRVRDPKAFKNMYRARLDALPADGPTADAMVEEANYAFSLNTRIFKELDAMAGFVGEIEPATPKAHPSEVATSGAPAAPAVSAEAIRAAAAGCPFAALVASGVPMPEGHPAFGDGQARGATKVKAQELSPLRRKDHRHRVWALLVMMALVLVITARWMKDQHP